MNGVRGAAVGECARDDVGVGVEIADGEGDGPGVLAAGGGGGDEEAEAVGEVVGAEAGEAEGGLAIDGGAVPVGFPMVFGGGARSAEASGDAGVEEVGERLVAGAEGHSQGVGVWGGGVAEVDGEEGGFAPGAVGGSAAFVVPEELDIVDLPTERA